MKIARVVSVPEAFVHIRDILRGLPPQAQVHLISSGESDLPLPFRKIQIERDIHLFKDVLAAGRLFLLFRREKYAIVHSSTPKAGLLAALAARLAGVPVRLHTFTGQRWATLRGPLRWLLITLDWLIDRLNTWSYTDSPSQLTFLRERGILKEGSSSCLGKGSYGGVRAVRFDLEEFAGKRKKTRGALEIGEETFVIIFVGQLCADKGVPDLLQAFDRLREQNALLLLVGPGTVSPREGVIAVGKRHPPDDFLAAADVLCLPSYREGFGTVVLEAAAAGIPAVGTDIVGLRDAIVDGVTGLLCEPGNPPELADTLEVFLRDREFLSTCGRRARERALRDFSSEKLRDLLWDEYLRLTNR